MDVRRELASFLRSRRDRLRPDDYGLPPGRRRSPGLRRTEVAQLAGISVDYYIRLEQGRSVRPSAPVLAGLARALKLTPDECDYLHRLAFSEAPAPAPTVSDRLRPGVYRLLEGLMPVPAYVISRNMDVLAWNEMGAALVADFGALPRSQRNLLWLLCCDPAARSLYVHWESAARQGVARLRLFAARYPDDQSVVSLVGELSVRSPEFRQWWACYDVQDCGSGRKEFNHPVVGRMSLDWEALLLPDGSDQYLVTYTAPAGSPSQGALDLLSVVGAETLQGSADHLGGANRW
ncbi:helix-turn-helix domain-containing protein [Streptosporangium algeriense]|uniref:Helix-turn-helix domain-containing protein n=1 Tax=Streptosporangium algeriense TaxID=1682748 RepID=A0ABW3E046_9ACTN